MPLYPPSQLDASQVLQHVMDDATQRLRVEASINAPVNVDGDILVSIDAADGDNILVLGTEDGTTSGTRHVVNVDSSGKLNINNISGTVSLPAGASTLANQLTEISHLSSIDTDFDVALSTRASEATLSTLNSKISNNYGISSGAVRTAAQIGNSTGSADFNSGIITAQTLRVTLPTNQTPPDFVTIKEYLTNGGSKNMNVDGTLGTPVIFSVAPTSGLTYFIESISFFINDTGTMDYTDFGAIAGALTNGILFRVISKGTTYNIVNITDNIDIAMTFKSDSLAGNGATSVGFFNDTDFFIGELTFENPIILQNSTSDQIEAQIRDSLSGINNLRCIIKYRKAS